MQILFGKSAFIGVAIGKIAILEKESQDIKRRHIDGIETELARVENACCQAIEQLDDLYGKAKGEVGESGAAVFEVHKMMITDDDYQDSIKNIIITQSLNAEYAVAMTGDNFAAIFEEMQDEYMRGRAADVKDISERLINILSGKEENQFYTEEPVILLAKDLAPSETVQLDKSKVLAFVTKEGSVNSHTAILARTLNTPAIVCLNYPEDCKDKLGIVDGIKGILILEPDEDTIKNYRKIICEEEERKTCFANGRIGNVKVERSL